MSANGQFLEFFALMFEPPKANFWVLQSRYHQNFGMYHNKNFWHAYHLKTLSMLEDLAKILDVRVFEVSWVFGNCDEHENFGIAVFKNNCVRVGRASQKFLSFHFGNCSV